MVASPWKFLVGLTRRHDKESKSAPIEDTSHKSVADATQEPAQLQPPAAPALTSDGAQDTADQIDADSHTSGDVPDIEKVVEEPAVPDESALQQVDDLASTTGRRQTVAVEVSATRRPRKTRAFRKKNESPKIQSTPSKTPAVSNDVQNLDDEIRQLRRQLAKKLQLQNAQLRRMLERFDR